MTERPLSTIFRDLNRFFPWPWFGCEAESAATAGYPVDVYEEDDHVVIDAEMPGFRSEDIDVHFDKGVLSISAERKAAERRGAEHLSERRFRRVERSFSLPTDVHPTKAEAKLQEGVLHIELPKTEESKQQKIKVM